MTRPRRLYTTDDGKFYYLIDGKKRFVKAPAGISQKQIAKINIKNIVNAPSAKRVKRRRKRVEPKYGAKVGNVLQKSETGGLPLYFFQPKKNIPTLEEQAKASGDTNIEKLTKELLKGLKPTPSSSKIGASIATQTDPEKINFGTQTEKQKKKKETTSGSEGDIEEEPKVPKRQISIDELVNIIEQVDKGGILNYGTVTGYIEKFYKNLYTNVSGPKYERALKMYQEKKDKEEMPPPPPKPSKPLPPTPKTTGIVGLKDYQTGEPLGSEFEIGTESEGAQGAKGTGSDDGLYNNEIEKIAKKRIKDYVPVIASDQVNELPRYVARGDKRFGFVINTASSDSDGSGKNGNSLGHWMSVYINNEDDYPTVEMFDPLAENKMSPELVSVCRKIAMKMNPSMMFKYKQNMLRRQSKMTSNCGHHAIKFLDDRFNGIPWSTATGYDDYMERLKSAPDDSVDGEKDIAKAMKKYESYI